MEHSSELQMITFDDIVFFKPGIMTDVPLSEEFTWIIPFLDSSQSGALRRVSFRFRNLPTPPAILSPNPDDDFGDSHLRGLDSVSISVNDVHWRGGREGLELFKDLFPIAASRGILHVDFESF